MSMIDAGGCHTMTLQHSTPCFDGQAYAPFLDWEVLVLLFEQTQVRQNMGYDGIGLVAPFDAGDVVRGAHNEAYPRQLPSFVGNSSTQALR